MALGNGGNADLRPSVSLLGAAGALGQGSNAAEAVAANTFGTASNVGEQCHAYTTVCLSLGSGEADAINGLYTGGIAKATRAATAGTQNEKDAAATAAVGAVPAANLATPGATNYDQSINGDDGRLNFEKGDMISGTTKFLTEIEARMGNVRGFMRVNGFYDAVLANDDNFLRSSGILESAEDEAIHEIQVLDAFIDYETDIGDIPVLIRVGNQVINWGESTFFLGGNSVFNAGDIPAICALVPRSRMHCCQLRRLIFQQA